jgi:hypothetical protein
LANHQKKNVQVDAQDRDMAGCKYARASMVHPQWHQYVNMLFGSFSSGFMYRLPASVCILSFSPLRSRQLPSPHPNLRMSHDGNPFG